MDTPELRIFADSIDSQEYLTQEWIHVPVALEPLSPSEPGAMQGAQLLRLRVLFRTPLAHVMPCKDVLQLITANPGLVDRSTGMVRSIARSPSMMREYVGRYVD